MPKLQPQPPVVTSFANADVAWPPPNANAVVSPGSCFIDPVPARSTVTITGAKPVRTAPDHCTIGSSSGERRAMKSCTGALPETRWRSRHSNAGVLSATVSCGYAAS